MAIEPSAKIAWCWLWELSGEKSGEVTLKPAEIAEECVATERSVRRWMKTLEAADLIEVVARTYSGEWMIQVNAPEDAAIASG
ncbi:MAG: helix-turn-helix domain-containing protein [Planctomycetales bacterium]